MTAAQPHGRLLARNTLLNLFAFGAPMVVALVATPLLVGGLGAERFGVLALAWMLLTYLGELGFGSTTTRFIARAIGRSDTEGLTAIAWTTALMQGLFGLLAGVALAGATPWLAGDVFNVPPALQAETRLCFYLLAAALPLVGLSKSFRGLLEARQRFDLTTAVRIPSTIANYFFPLVGVWAGWSLPAIFGLLLASRLSVLVAYAVLAVLAFPEVSWRPRLYRQGLREVLGFGGWITVSSVASPLLVYMDRFVIGSLMTMAAVAYYAAPYELVVRLSVIPMAVVTTLYPAFSQLHGAGQRERTNLLAARAVKAILVVVAPPALLLVGGAEEGLRLWLGAEFAREGALALQILGAGVLINALAHVPYVLLQGAGRPDLPARFHLLELPVHAAVTWLAVSRWGIPGAAGAWTLRVTLDAVLLFAASHRLGLLRLPELARERVGRALVMVAVAGGVVLAPVGPGVTPRLAFVGAVIAAVAVLLWRFGMVPAERARIRMLLGPAASS